MRRARQSRRTHHTVWAVILLVLCALATPAVLFYPNILRTVSPKTYVSYVCARTEKNLSRDAEKIRALWGFPIWETLLHEPSYMVADCTLTTVEDILNNRSPFPDGLHWQAEAWFNETADVLSARQTLDWNGKTFFLEGRLTGDTLAVNVPQLYTRPVSFSPLHLGTDWNRSFLSEIATLPEALSLTAPQQIKISGEMDISKALYREWRTLSSKAKLTEFKPVSSSGIQCVFSLPPSDGLLFLDALAGFCQNGIGLPQLLPGFNETLEALLDDTETVFTHCAIEMDLDNASHLRRFSLIFSSSAEDRLSLDILFGEPPSPTDELTLAIRRTRAGQPETTLRLTAAGLVTPTAAGLMESDIALVISSDGDLQETKLHISFDLHTATDNLYITASHNGTHGELNGGYAADPESNRVSLYVNRLTFGDDQSSFTLEGQMRCDWRSSDSNAPQPPPAPEDPQPIDTLDRFEQAALLDSFYRLFYHD